MRSCVNSALSSSFIASKSAELAFLLFLYILECSGHASF
jgi:hypothetical protein